MELATIQDLAQLSEAVYKFKPYNGWKVDKRFVAGVYKTENIDEIKGIKETEGSEGTKGTKKLKPGFQAALYSNGDEKVVAYCGSNDFEDWEIANASMAAGIIPDQAREAIEFFEDIVGIRHGNRREEDIYNRRADTPSFDIIVIGHSLGGALATIVGNKYALYTVAFNSPGTGGLTTRIHDSNADAGYPVELQPSKEAHNKIHQYIISNDSVSNGTGHFGQVHIAQAHYGVEHWSAHLMNQWLKSERYDGDGNYDPSKKINMPPESLLIENGGD